MNVDGSKSRGNCSKIAQIGFGHWGVTDDVLLDDWTFSFVCFREI
jgi:hypothetical protein